VRQQPAPAAPRETSDARERAMSVVLLVVGLGAGALLAFGLLRLVLAP
jgi:hypothetical protein